MFLLRVLQEELVLQLPKSLRKVVLNVILHGRDESKLKEIMKNTGAVGYFAVVCALKMPANR